MAPPSATLFAGGVLAHVIGHHEVGLVADLQILRRDRDATSDELVNFLKQHDRVEHHAVADAAHHAFAEDAHGQQVRGVLLAADADGVPGVGPAAVAGDDVGVLGEEVDDLALAFVAPLESDDARVAFESRYHEWLPRKDLSTMPMRASSRVPTMGRAAKCRRGITRRWPISARSIARIIGPDSSPNAEQWHVIEEPGVEPAVERSDASRDRAAAAAGAQALHGGELPAPGKIRGTTRASSRCSTLRSRRGTPHRCVPRGCRCQRSRKCRRSSGGGPTTNDRAPMRKRPRALRRPGQAPDRRITVRRPTSGRRTSGRREIPDSSSMPAASARAVPCGQARRGRLCGGG